MFSVTAHVTSDLALSIFKFFFIRIYRLNQSHWFCSHFQKFTFSYSCMQSQKLTRITIYDSSFLYIFTKGLSNQRIAIRF